MADGLTLLTGSLLLRGYVFGFLLLYLLVAAIEWGWRRALLFTGLAASLALAAEWTSTRIGVPFGLYHYTETTRGTEVYLGNVPLFDPLSFTFLAYASLGVARLVLAGSGDRAGLAVATGLLMTWLDLVIDPLAVRGDRWFLGRIFYYPSPGRYFGVPVANFVGWAVLGTVIAGLWLFGVAPAARGRGARSATSRPGGRTCPVAVGAVAIYYLVVVFNLALTAWIGEPWLFATGVGLHLPLLGVVLWSLGRSRRRGSGPSRLKGGRG